MKWIWVAALAAAAGGLALAGFLAAMDAEGRGGLFALWCWGLSLGLLIIAACLVFVL